MTNLSTVSTRQAAEVPLGREALPLDRPAARRQQVEIAGSSPWAKAGRVMLLLTSDVVVIALVSLAAILFWAVRVRQQPLEMYVRLWPLLGLFVLSYASAGLYPGFGLGPVETLRRLWVRTNSVFLLLAATSFALKVPPQYSRGTYFLVWLGLLLALPAARLRMLRIVSQWSWWQEPALLVGNGALARRFLQGLRKAVSPGCAPRWVVTTAPESEEVFEGLPVIGEVEMAPAVARAGVRYAIVAKEEPEHWRGTLAGLEQTFRHVLVIRDGQDLGLENLEVRSIAGVIAIEFRNELLRRRNRLLKRGMDLVIAVGGLTLALPILGLSAIVIKATSPGPAFLWQPREGVGGRVIRIWKLRTMYRDAQARLEGHFEEAPEARREWEENFKLKQDPRVIPVVGAFLRRFSIDELPQLLNVLRGEMSIVGPRPFPEYHLEAFSPEFRALRRRVRPGLTGQWQVMVRSEGNVALQELWDSYYIRNWSVWLDLYIMGKTVGAVLRGRGAY